MRIGRFGVAPRVVAQVRVLVLLVVLHLAAQHELLLVVEGASSLGLSGVIRTSSGTNLTSPGGIFEFGFYLAPGSSDRYGVAIWYAQLPRSVRTIVWILAGRNTTLSSSAYLQLNSQGGVLQLFEPAVSAQQPVWQSVNYNGNNATSLELRDTGNLVLVDATKTTIVWQSFDTPTDTLLPDQMFSVNNTGVSLVSWKTTSDWSDGYYRAGWVNVDGQNNFTLSWTGESISNWNRSSWTNEVVTQGNITLYPYQNDTTGATYAILDANLGSFYLGSTNNPVITNTSIQGSSVFRRVTLDWDGGLRMYSWATVSGASAWNDEGIWINDTNSCRILAECGPFGVCNYNPFTPAASASCTCPPQFTAVDATNMMKGCKPVNEIPTNQCSVNTSLFQMVKVGDIDYPFADRMYPGYLTDEASCTQRCLNECGCAGVTYWRRGFTCFIKSSPLFNGGFPQQVGNRTAYLKVLKSPLSGSAASGTNVALVAGICAASGVIVLTVLGLIGFGYWRRRRRRQGRSSFINHHLHGPRRFTLRELSVATKSFADSERVGTGGMGSVYKGVLRPSGDLIAVKRIRHESPDGEVGFLAEASSISQIRHRNLMQLQGWCHEDGKLLLVYDFMPNGSLDQWLHGRPSSLGGSSKSLKRSMARSMPREPLSWDLRFSILQGVAAALAYLHDEWQQCVLHRDIKSSNVMLDAEFNAHLGDFGLARVIDHQKVEKTTLMAGTLGYMAPEMPYTGKATKESDVYSFGVLMLEVVSGRQPVQSMGDIEPDDVVLLNRVWRAYEAGELLRVVDPALEAGNTQTLRFGKSPSGSQSIRSLPKDQEELDYTLALSRRIEEEILSENEQKTMVLKMGLLCCLPNPMSRPTMRLINQVFISGDTTALPTLPNTAYFGSEDVLSAVRSGFHPQPLVSEQSVSPSETTAHSNSSEKWTPTGNSISSDKPED